MILAVSLCALAQPGWPAAASNGGSLQEHALAPRSGPGLGPMFTELAVGDTGLVTENQFSDPKMWWERYIEFTSGAVGTGLAVGDYDADGRPDLFVVSKTEANRLFRNLGGWKFEDVTEKAGVANQTSGSAWAWMKELVGAASQSRWDAWGQGATFADVDNDGWLDLYVCRFGAPNLLYINQGDGTFREEAAQRGLAVVDGSTMGAFADFDRDGRLDCYLQTNLLNYKEHPRGQPDYLFRNRGDGTFEDVTETAGIAGESQGHSATWWDYDDDGWPDLYVANDFSVPDRLYRNNHDGTFTDVVDRAVPHTPFSSMGADLGDVNNDGLIDFLVTDMASTTPAKDLRGMADSRSSAWKNKDGSAPQYPRNALLLGTGTDRCLEAAFLAGLSATDWTWSARFEDLDNDGRLDLHVTNGMVRELNNADLVAGTMASASISERIKIMRASPILAEANLAFRNAGDLRFENVSTAWGLDHTGVSFGTAFGDFDSDGDLDLVFANYQAGVTVLRNDCDTGRRVTIGLRGTRSNSFGVGATVQLDAASGIQIRQLVLARGYLSSSEPILHFGLGDENHIRRLTVSWPSGATQVFENLSADRHFTIVEPSAPASTVPPAGDRSAPQFTEVGETTGFALQMTSDQDDEKQQKLLPVRHDRLGPAMAIGDLDGDGIDDVCVSGVAPDPARVLVRNASGKHRAHIIPEHTATVSVNDGPLLVFDANGDGAQDLLISKGAGRPRAGSPEYQPRLLLNDGSGALVPAPEGVLPPLPISTGALATADFDRDGRLDLFIGGRVMPGRYPEPPRSAILANQDGRFVDVTDSAAPGLREIGMVTSALWSDVDDDGWLDLLVALEWGGVRFWRNMGGRSFEDRSEGAGFTSAGTGWWCSLAAADFNGDRRPDYIAGNVGLNTQYQASPERPALLFVGDFGSKGGPHLVEARWDHDRQVPWRNLKDLGSAIPSIRRRVRSNDAFASATLGELLGEDHLAAAQRLAATELRSGVFLSGPDGRFRFEPLPRLAQIAPLQGLAAGDFDGDGRADVYALQNSHAPNPTVGRFDGGLSQLLRGDGRGHFEPAAPRETGLIVPGDGEALAVVDLDRNGWPDFLVTRYGEPTLAFRNNGVAGRSAFRVVLRGPSGNPTASGARVTVELADGTTQTSEVYLGSGYMSQSAPGIHFGFTDSNPPRRLHVRWPSSRETSHAITSPLSAELVINAP